MTDPAAVHQRNGEAWPTLKLHPLLQQLKFKCGQSFEDVVVSKAFEGSKTLKLACIEARKEQATSPALRSITLESSPESGCRGRGAGGCGKLHRVEGRNGAVTAEELLKGFIESLDDLCSACKAQLKFARFKAWRVKRVTTEGEVRFEEPLWGERK